MALLALMAFAPSVAEAGCSHLVTSRDDANRRASLLEPLERDLAGPSDTLPTSPARLPCSGAWCARQSAIPPVPPGVFEGRLGSWAWCASRPDEDSTAPRSIVVEIHILVPPRRGNDVFHPPRHRLPL